MPFWCEPYPSDEFGDTYSGKIWTHEETQKTDSDRCSDDVWNAVHVSGGSEFGEDRTYRTDPIA